MPIRGKRTKRAPRRDHGDPPQPSTSLGVKNDKNKIQKKEPVKGFNALNNKQKSAPFNSEQNDEDNGYNDGTDREMQLIMEEIYKRLLLKQQAAVANKAKKCIEATFGLSNDVRPSIGGSHVETDRQKVISVEGISNSGKRITRSQGRGRSGLPGPSQYCINPPPQPVHTSVSPGVKNGKNITQNKSQEKGVNTLNNKLKSTAFNPEKNDEHCDNNDGEDEELQHIIEKICQSQSHEQQATDANNVENYIGSSFGLSNNARSPNMGYNVETVTRVKSVEGISNTGRGVRRGPGKDRSDSRRPSKSCIDPPAQPAHTSIIPGVKNDNRIQKKGRGKKVNTLNNKQKSTVFNSEQNDEHYDNNNGEDEDLELVPEESIQPRVHMQQATNANNVERYIGSDLGLSNSVRLSSVGYHVENDTRKVISVEGISNPGRGISCGQGRGCSDPSGPSQSCIDPPPADNSVFPGFQNVYNKIQRKGLVKGVDALNNKQKATAFSSEHIDEYFDDSDGEDEEMQLLMEKIYQRQLRKRQAAIVNNVKKSIGASFGLSNDMRPSSGGSHIDADRRKVASVDGISNLVRGNKRSRGIGRSDPPGPSQSCIDLPPATHTSVSQGMKNDKNKMQKEGLVKALDALNNKQKFTAVSSGEKDDYSDYDDGEYEEMQLMGEKIIEQQSLRQIADTNNVKQYNRGNSEVSNHGSMGSASSESVPNSTDLPAKGPTSLPLRRSCVETNRREVISIEDNPNPRRFVPQSVTRYIISNVIVRMPIPAAKWREYPIEMKDELFKDFMDKYKFASDSERSIARMVWERTCLDRYPDHLKNARKVALRQVNSTNLADTKDHGPKGLKPEVWNGLVDIWLKPEWMKKSDANRCNRASKPDSVLHTGGSISFTEHKKRLEEELKQGVSYRDVYAHVHKRKDGEYVSRRSEKFIELYDTVMLEKYGEDSSNHPVFDSKVWAEVSGMDKKKRRAYEGRSYDVDTPGPMPISYPQDIGPSRIAAPTEEYIKEAVNTAMASFVQTQLAPMLQPILSMIGGSIREALSQGRVADRDGEDE
ncbi:uncharacterized protein LOC131651374 isoform X3 [Vicia villosa]|uniref:uncharacterized protein LOC131651374 isoform X3 n=1 Tax=Vicia villosa TaxID=3911 RepID=UPI00273C23D9|nr:uncharacterized protein LOC131651374 isoform X3 [Vicia villosa]